MRFIRRCSARLCRAILIASTGVVAITLATLAMQNTVVLPLIVGGIVYQKYRRRWNPTADSHGSASWADMGDLARSGLLGEDGFILGRAGYAAPIPRWRAVMALLSPRIRSDIACCLFYHAFLTWRRGNSRIIRLQRMVHGATFAPAGRGKGVSVVVPNLLSYRGGTVVTDPKGENFKLTHRHRKRRFRHRIIRLDPEQIGGPGSDAINPLSFFDPNSPSLLDDCRSLANMLVVRQGTEHDPHWNDSAELVLTAFIALVVVYEKNPRDRNLQTVRKLLSSPDKYAKSVAIMQQYEGPNAEVINRLGGMIGFFQDKELNSVLTHVQRHTQFLDSPAIQAITQASTFDPRQLRGPASVYLILPPERLVTLAPLMRMWLGTIIRVLAKGEASERNPVLFLLDEAAHLGKMQVIEDAVTLMRGYGIRLWFFFQSIGQLNTCFGDHAPIILGNLETQQHFGISSYEDAEELSKRLGDATIVVSGGSDTTGTSNPTGPGAHGGPTPGSRTHSSTVNYSMTGRRLAFANELITAGDDFAVILQRNLPPIPRPAPPLLRREGIPPGRHRQGGRLRFPGPGGGGPDDDGQPGGGVIRQRCRPPCLAATRHQLPCRDAGLRWPAGRCRAGLLARCVSPATIPAARRFLPAVR